jgi:sulfur-carrier protein
MKIYTYAILKDYFDKEFVVDEQVNTIEGLNNLLTQKNPAAAAILAACRYAVKDDFVTSDFVLHASDIIHIIPPSSGG